MIHIPTKHQAQIHDNLYSVIRATTFEEGKEKQEEHKRIAADIGGVKVNYNPNSTTYHAISETKEKRKEFEIRVAGEDDIDVLLNQYRKWLAAHSYLYYHMNKTLVSDKTWDKKAIELSLFQQIHMGYGNDLYRESFEGFDGSTGMDLPKDEKIVSIAEQFSSIKNKIENKNAET